jgi:2'-5' RNA ligase
MPASVNVIRAFIAINLSEEIYNNLDKVLAELKSRLPHAPLRWSPPRNIHLTIKFLGDVSTANLELLTKMLQNEVVRHPSFEISVGDLGSFPSMRRPRVVWVGVKAPSELLALQRGVEGEMARLGYAHEERPFSPHLTLGRVSRNANPNDLRQIGEVLESCKVGYLGAACIQAVHLFRSDLQPGGSVYTRLFSAPLNEVGCP